MMQIHNTYKKIANLYFMVFFFILGSCKESIEESNNPLTPVPTDSKMTWWNDARYGMFIHWGVYSALAGEYIGKNIKGESIHFQTVGNNNSNVDTVRIGAGAGAEWILYEASISRNSYRKYASSFTAEYYDPEFIVKLAQQAGMKYIVITAKHHDGFCLWNSQATDWNVSQTPAGIRWNNDLIAPLAKAARAAGLKFGVYFSHTRDWMHSGGVGQIPELNMEEYSYAESQNYMRTYTYPMISDLLNKYDPDIFWWDSYNTSEEFAKHCNSLIKNFSPTIIQNNRISALPSYQGDYITPEQSMSENEEFENMELCMTMNESWGYNKFDNGWKKPEFILWSLLRANKLGGNLLLNIGPRADGTIPEESQTVLKTIGEWIHNNSSGVYSTRRSPFQFNLPYGPTTWSKKENNSHLYYHIFYWDGSGELWLPGIMNAVDEVELSFPAAPHLYFQIEAIKGKGLHITGLPKMKFSNLCTMLDIKFKSEPILVEGIREINNIISLDALGAQIENIVIDDFNKKPCLNWYAGRCINYKIKIDSDGMYKISTLLAGFYSGTITFDFGNGVIVTGNNQATSTHDRFEWQTMGNISLTSGIYNLSITANQVESWLKVREFKLERI